MNNLPARIDPSNLLYMDAPFSVDARGRSSLANVDAHVREMIIAVLFTNPGERVNQPEFGCGIRQLLFAPNSNLLASATEALAAAALNRWLSDWIVVQNSRSRPVESTLGCRSAPIWRRDTREVSQLVISREDRRVAIPISRARTISPGSTWLVNTPSTNGSRGGRGGAAGVRQRALGA